MKSFNGYVRVHKFIKTSGCSYLICNMEDILKEHDVFDPRVFSIEEGHYVCVCFPVKEKKIPAFLTGGRGAIIHTTIEPGRFGFSNHVLEEVIVNDEILVHVDIGNDIRYSVVYRTIEDPKSGIRTNSVLESKNGHIRIIENVAVGYRNIFFDYDKIHSSMNDDDMEDESEEE